MCAAASRREARYAAGGSLPALRASSMRAPDAVGLLREVRRRPLAGHYVSLSGADPLNLLASLRPGCKLPVFDRQSSAVSRRIAHGHVTAGEVTFLNGARSGRAVAGQECRLSSRCLFPAVLKSISPQRRRSSESASKLRRGPAAAQSFDSRYARLQAIRSTVQCSSSLLSASSVR